MLEISEDICRKLRYVVSEFSQTQVTPAVIIGPEEIGPQVGGHQYFVCPTIGKITLANVGWKIARCFEDA